MHRLILALMLWMILPVLAHADSLSTTYIQPNAVQTQNLTRINNQDLPPVIELAPIKVSAQSLVESKNVPSKYTGFISYVSSNYKFKKKLHLVSATASRHKRAFMFVFLMNNRQVNQEKAEKPHKRMHILWTGSKKMFTDQTIIDDEYPIDVTIAPYKDGYSPGEWNVVLPNKKPREVLVSFLWTF